MHAIFALEIAVGKLSLDLHCTRLYTHLVARLIVEHLDLITVGLAPAGVHTQQHICPVERLGATRACVNVNNSAHLILLTAQHITQLERLNGLNSSGIGSIKFLLCSKRFSNKIGHHNNLLNLCRNALKVGNPTLYASDLLQLLLGSFGIIPKVWLKGLLLLVLELYFLAFDVKDTSSTYPDVLQYP